MGKTDNWAAFGSEWIKAIDVLSDTDEYVIVGVDSSEEEKNGVKKEVLHLDIERGEMKKKFGCNATNTYAVQVACPNGPKDAIGRIITFNKVDAQKPGTNPPEMVKGLRLVFKDTDEPEEVDSDDAGVDEEGEM